MIALKLIPSSRRFPTVLCQNYKEQLVAFYGVAFLFNVTRIAEWKKHQPWFPAERLSRSGWDGLWCIEFGAWYNCMNWHLFPTSMFVIMTLKLNQYWIYFLDKMWNSFSLQRKYPTKYMQSEHFVCLRSLIWKPLPNSRDRTELRPLELEYNSSAVVWWNQHKPATHERRKTRHMNLNKLATSDKQLI